MNFVPLFFFCGLMGFLLVSVGIDRARKRRDPGALCLSVIIPCYNGRNFVGRAVESVFASWPRERLEVVVINDCSTDGSGEVIEALAARFPIRRIHNAKNKGKAASLNEAVAGCRHECVLFLDADTETNASAIRDLLCRLVSSRGVAAVSSPCTPGNRGWLPAMQTIEYNMHRLSMGASNLTSVHALWGGCLLTRKSVFLELGGFAGQAITEDTDYAFRLNRAGYRVEQGFARVKTQVPDTLRAWIRQKIRWAGGAFQCGFRYPGVWLKNPVVLCSLLVYSLLTLNGLVNLFDSVSSVEVVREFADAHHPLGEDMPETISRIREDDQVMKVVADGVMVVVMTLGTLLYVFPMVSRVRDSFKLVWVIPYLLGYLPLFMLATAGGFLFWGVVLRKLHVHQRAW